jgi:stage IV sporulation protein FB
MAYSDFKTRGFRVGRIFGIDIWLHWLLLVLLLYDLFTLWTNTANTAEDFALHLTWRVATFLVILLHEFGHCYAAHRVGGRASAVVLWPFGGLAHCDAPMTPRAQFWVAAGGPLVNVAMAIILGVVLLTPLVPVEAQPHLFSFQPPGSSYILSFIFGVFQWNIILLVLNLLPIYPLDGGRILQSILWGRLESFGNACLKTVWVTRVTLLIVVLLAILGAVEAVGLNRWFVFIIAIWAYIQTEQLRMSLMQASEDGSLFGYDFSRGYSSMDHTVEARPPRPRKPSIRERLKQRRDTKEQERRARTRQRVDTLLEKISREGMNSLTSEERQFLEEASGDV